ncbi:MAG: type III-A CRISPR-associated protein Csm2 [Terriglobia bacterium]
MNMQDAFKKAGVVTPPPQGAYFDEHGNLRLEFVAKKTIEPLLERFKKDKPELKMSQLRAFFGYCREVERRLKTGESTWEAQKSKIAMLSSYAAYRAGKKDPTIPRSFQEFIDENVQKVQKEDDFLKGFMQHFEGLLGFAPLKLR